MFVYVSADVLCAFALGSGTSVVKLFVVECEGEGESVSIKIYLQGEGL